MKKHEGYTHYVLTPVGMYPKYPVKLVMTPQGLIAKEQPKVYRFGSCLITIRP